MQSRKPNIWTGLLTMRNMLTANILRELNARMGSGLLSYLGSMSGSLITMMIFYFLRAALKAPMPLPVDMFTAIASGFGPYLLFRFTLTESTSSMTSNKALLFYPGTRPLDLALATGVLEGMIVTVSFAIMLTVNYQYVDPPQHMNPLKLIIALFATWLLGFGLGLCQMSFIALYPQSKILFSIATRPLLFISGVMFVAIELPYSILDILWWNPLFHAIEIGREGLAIDYESPVSDEGYLAFWIMMLFAIGMVGERYMRRNLRS